MQRRKRVTAAVFGTLAIAELTSWLVLRGAMAALATAGVLALGVAALAALASGAELR
jgi:hypothetical protein